MYNTHMCDMLMNALGGKPLVTGSAIMEFVLMCSIDTWRLWTLSFTTNNLMSMCLDFDELRLFVEYNCAALLSQLILNGFSIPSTNFQLCDKILQPYPMVWCLIAGYEFCLHSGRSNKCLFNTFPWNCSSSQHEDVAWSGSPTIKTSREIGIRDRKSVV